MMISQYQSELKTYGEPIQDYRGTLLQIITRFATAYTAAIEGVSKNIVTSELYRVWLNFRIPFLSLSSF